MTPKFVATHIIKYTEGGKVWCSFPVRFIRDGTEFDEVFDVIEKIIKGKITAVKNKDVVVFSQHVETE